MGQSEAGFPARLARRVPRGMELRRHRPRIELNEAFAVHGAVPCALGLGPRRGDLLTGSTVNGSRHLVSVHPFAATGGRSFATLLREDGSPRGAVSGSMTCHRRRRGSRRCSSGSERAGSAGRAEHRGRCFSGGAGQAAVLDKRQEVENRPRSPTRGRARRRPKGSEPPRWGRSATVDTGKSAPVAEPGKRRCTGRRSRQRSLRPLPNPANGMGTAEIGRSHPRSGFLLPPPPAPRTREAARFAPSRGADGIDADLVSGGIHGHRPGQRMDPALAGGIGPARRSGWRGPEPKKQCRRWRRRRRPLSMDRRNARSGSRMSVLTADEPSPNARVLWKAYRHRSGIAAAFNKGYRLPEASPIAA